MVSNRMFLIVLVILAMALSACASSSSAVQPPAAPTNTELVTTPEPTVTEELSTTPVAVSHGSEIGGYVELVDALRAAGATVGPAGEVEQVFFSVKGQKIEVNGAEVQVFEYSDDATRKAESDQISPDGTNIGTSMVTWIDQPNFWAKGRLIVFYLGKDPAMLTMLNTILGEPITQRP